MDTNTSITILCGLMIVGLFGLGAYVFWLNHKEAMAMEAKIIKRQTGKYRTPEFKSKTTVTTKKETPE